MTEVLYTGRVPLERLDRLVSVCRFAPEAIFLAEALPTLPVESRREREALLQCTRYNQQLRCADYDTGRIFQVDRELRWERQHAEARVVYIGEIERESELTDCQLQKKNILDQYQKKAGATGYYLFGERLRDEDLPRLSKIADKGDFAVLRIPRTLRYPVKINEDPYARLLLCEYLDEATGRVSFYRFQGMETWGKAAQEEVE
jgi:hypothetical protein